MSGNEQVAPLIGSILGAFLNPQANAKKLEGIMTAPMKWTDPRPISGLERERVLESAVEAARVRYYALLAELYEARGNALWARWHAALAASDWATADACHAEVVKERDALENKPAA